VKKMDKVDGPDADKTERIKLEFLMDPDQASQHQTSSTPDSLLSSRMDAQWIGSSAYLVMAFREIENLMPMKEPADKTRMFRTLLKGQALSYFEHHLIMKLEAEDSDAPDNELIELVLRDVGLECIPKRAMCVQK
jgi:hypothetical protein